MSNDSPDPKGPDLAKLAVQFTREDHKHYSVYHAKVNQDLVYQFWPAANTHQLPPGFPLLLEKPFKTNLHHNTPVAAEYHDHNEARLIGIMRPDGSPDDPVSDMVYVKIIGGAMLIGNKKILRGELFQQLDRILQDKYNVPVEVASPAPSPSRALSRRARRLRK